MGARAQVDALAGEAAGSNPARAASIPSPTQSDTDKIAGLERELGELKKEFERTQKENETLRKLLQNYRERLTLSIQTLTSWLAMRGSYSKEFFEATQGLASQSVKAINFE